MEEIKYVKSNNIPNKATLSSTAPFHNITHRTISPMSRHHPHQKPSFIAITFISVSP